MEDPPLDAPAGTILVAWVYTGCSYHYDFARVQKVTPTGRLRVVALYAETGEPDHQEHCIYQAVRPGAAIPGMKPFQLSAQGRKAHSSWRCIKDYKVYNPEEVLTNFTDFGD